MHITDRLTYLEELLILIDGLLVLSKVVIEDTSRVIGSALISRFAGPLAGEGKDVVVLQTLLSGDTVVGIRICHVQPTVTLKDTRDQVVVSIEQASLVWFIKVRDLLVCKAFHRNDIFLALGSVEVDGELDALRLVHSQREV